jgi:hypothetical protein
MHTEARACKISKRCAHRIQNIGVYDQVITKMSYDCKKLRKAQYLYVCSVFVLIVNTEPSCCCCCDTIANALLL